MTIDFNNLNINDLSPKTKFEENVVNFVKDWFSDNRTVQAQTSGSTGTPKIYDIDKIKMQNSAEMTCKFLKIDQGKTALLCLPVEYISGKMMVIRSIVKNLKLSIENATASPLENLESEIDFCAMTPLQVSNSLEKIHFIKKLIIGGAQVSGDLKIKITKELQDKNAETQVYETFGMTETLSHIALREIYPFENTYFTLLEDIEISTDEIGRLHIYAPRLNEAKITTNDIIEIQNEREFRFVGRADNIINSAGAKIYPEQLEFLAKKHISQELIFTGKKDSVLGEKLVLVLEGKKDDEVYKHIEEIKFDKSFHKPKEILFFEKLPRTPNGKINRISIKKLVNEKF